MLTATPAVPANPLYTLWKAASSLPGGRFVFHRLLGRTLPYATSINPTVEVLAPGHAIVSMSDRPSVRNHLQGVHGAAIVNLAESAAGLALASLLPEGWEPQVKTASIEHRRAALGLLTAECKLGEVDPHSLDGQPLEVLVRDRKRHIVAEASISFDLRRPSAAARA